MPFLVFFPQVNSVYIYCMFIIYLLIFGFVKTGSLYVTLANIVNKLAFYMPQPI